MPTYRTRKDRLADLLADMLEGGANARISSSLGNLGDGTAAPVVTGLNLSVSFVRDGNGKDTGLITVSWTPILPDPTEAHDASQSPVKDYQISYSFDAIGVPDASKSYSRESSDTTPPSFIANLPIDKFVTVRIRARTEANQYGPFAYAAITTVHDTTPPNQPSTPTVTGIPGGLVVNWDGKDYLGAAMPGDWARTEVHVSSVSGFTPTSATKFGGMVTTPASIPINGLPASSTYYVKLIAVDETGNASTPSAQASGTTGSTSAVDTSVGTLRNTDVTMFASAKIGVNPSPPGDMVLAGTASRVADSQAFDQIAIEVSGGSTGSMGKVQGYTRLKPGKYVATFYLYLTSGAGGGGGVCDLHAGGSNIAPGATFRLAQSDFAQNGRIYGFALDFAVLDTSNSLDLWANSYGTGAAFRISHITVDPDQGGVASGQIRTEFVRNLAILDAKIGSAAVDKLVAGNLYVNVSIATGGQIQAGSLFGNHTIITPLGVFGYQGATEFFALDNTTGSARFTGAITGGTITGSVIQTAPIYNSRVVLADGSIVGGYSGVDAIRWYSSANTVQTELRGQMGVTGGDGLFINSAVQLGHQYAKVYLVGALDTAQAACRIRADSTYVNVAGGVGRVNWNYMNDLPTMVVATPGGFSGTGGVIAQIQVTGVDHYGFDFKCYGPGATGGPGGGYCYINYIALYVV